jgi:hypothetical protein
MGLPFSFFMGLFQDERPLMQGSMREVPSYRYPVPIGFP